MIRCIAAAFARPIVAVLEWLYPARHLETEGPRMLGVFEAEGEVLENGTVLIRPDPLATPTTIPWSPFDNNSNLRTEELRNEGWHIVGSMKEE